MCPDVIEIYILFQRFESIDEVRPYLMTLWVIKILVMERELDAWFKCFVERADAVAGEDENSYDLLMHGRKQ